MVTNQATSDPNDIWSDPIDILIPKSNIKICEVVPTIHQIYNEISIRQPNSSSIIH